MKIITVLQWSMSALYIEMGSHVTASLMPTSVGIVPTLYGDKSKEGRWKGFVGDGLVS